ncbi:hypothetical protein Cfor_12354 [Coptotermes formosanus]|uniref:Uncharacterized protein n=1 Tax=Coptotermes formosanus TaxID=36987 RepID=A0A6L2PJK1_COPFO|nr:hypothetical protein Cfor_12354 [Coptotermes formosanus]
MQTVQPKPVESMTEPAKSVMWTNATDIKMLDKMGDQSKIKGFKDIARKQVCVLNHPPCSPDLPPCDYFLFPKLKLPLKGRLFEDVQDTQGAETSSLPAIPQEDVQKSFQSLLDRATRCIDAEGMYFE